MDAFYVSVELRRRPDLAGQPVVVGGTGLRGVVAAASYEARRFGVHSALPSAIARRRCPHAVFLPGDHELYASVSAEVLEIFGRYSPLIEPLSLDEAFIDVTGAVRLFGDGVTIAERVRSDVRGELDLNCSVGVAPNKFLAKMASVEAKPRALPDRIDPGRGVVEVRPGEELAFLHPLPVHRLWGVGPVTRERLERLGVRTVADLAALDQSVVIGALGSGQGTHLLALAHGSDDRPVEVDRAMKSIGHEETFAHDLHERSDVQRHVVRLADAVASRLRHQHLGARTVTVKIRFAGFHTITRSVTLDAPVDTGIQLVEALGPLLEHIDPSPGVRLVGVSTTNFGEPIEQLSLLDDLSGDSIVKPLAKQRRRLAAGALDEIRERFGTGAIGPASAVEAGGLRVVRRGAQQWGPDQQPDAERGDTTESSERRATRPDKSGKSDENPG